MKLISEFVKRTYVDYFGVKFDDQDKLYWAPHTIIKTCMDHLDQNEINELIRNIKLKYFHGVF